MPLQSLKNNKSHFITHCFIQLNNFKRKEKPLTSNKFKVSKITARIYSKSTGKTVDTNKIQSTNPTENTDAIPVKKLSDYYKSITNEDNAQAICTDDTSPNIGHNLKESVNIESCNLKASDKKTVTNDITLGNKGKLIIPSRYQIN